MQPQGQQMQGMGMQMGQPMQQPTPPETQSNMQPIQNENQINQPITQQPDALQAPGMIQNGNMNMAQPQIYEKPAVEPKQEMAAAAPPPPPPPNFPPISTQPPANSDLNLNIASYDSTNNIKGPNTKELIGDADKAKEKLRQDIENFKNDLTPAELEVYQEAFRS